MPRPSVAEGLQEYMLNAKWCENDSSFCSECGVQKKLTKALFAVNSSFLVDIYLRLRVDQMHWRKSSVKLRMCLKK